MTAKKFKILDHLADLKIRAWGKNLPEVFINMATGMLQAQKHHFSKPTRAEREITVSSTDKHSLLIDFLSEILYLSAVNKEVYPQINITQFSETKLKAKLQAVKVNQFDLEIKAVTYGQGEVKKIKDGWEAIVIFDI